MSQKKLSFPNLSKIGGMYSIFKNKMFQHQKEFLGFYPGRLNFRMFPASVIARFHSIGDITCKKTVVIIKGLFFIEYL